MTTQERISVTEATALAGVSARTLKRFQDSGYLEVVTTDQGEPCYLKAQIIEIFGAAEALSPRPVFTPPPPYSSSEAPSCGMSPFNEPEAEEASSTTSAPSPSLSAGEQSSTPLAREIERLKNLVTLQERILDMKDSEITDLRSQRDWLRSRVERLEEKSERDQILLLSETQTIRKLVSMQDGRKTALQNILEWLGIAKQPELRQLTGPGEFSNSDTVEVKSSAANA